jgi:hypothetical protein
MNMELRYEKLARTKVIKFLTKKEMYNDGVVTRKEYCLLYNLSLTDLGLNTAIRVIAEFVEKRVALGDFEETAWEMALSGLESFLECPWADCIDRPENSDDFVKYLAEWWMPFVELPDGTVIHNRQAYGEWQDGVWEGGVYYSRSEYALRIAKLIDTAREMKVVLPDGFG